MLNVINMQCQLQVWAFVCARVCMCWRVGASVGVRECICLQFSVGDRRNFPSRWQGMLKWYVTYSKPMPRHNITVYCPHKAGVSICVFVCISDSRSDQLKLNISKPNLGLCNWFQVVEPLHWRLIALVRIKIKISEGSSDVRLNWMTCGSRWHGLGEGWIQMGEQVVVFVHDIVTRDEM